MIATIRKITVFLFLCVFFSLYPGTGKSVDMYSLLSVITTSVNGTTIQIEWHPSDYTDRYLIYRNYAYLAEVDEASNTNPDNASISYYDTGLSPGRLYSYVVYTVINGSTHESFEYWEVPMDPPVITSIRSWLDTNQNLFCVELSWKDMDYVTGYGVYARVGQEYNYSRRQVTLDAAATLSFPLPAETTTYAFKVRAYMDYSSYRGGSSSFPGYFPGPFSGAETATFYSIDSSVWNNVDLVDLQTLNPSIELITSKPNDVQYIKTIPTLIPALPTLAPNILPETIQRPNLKTP